MFVTSFDEQVPDQVSRPTLHPNAQPTGSAIQLQQENPNVNFSGQAQPPLVPANSPSTEQQEEEPMPAASLAATEGRELSTPPFEELVEARVEKSGAEATAPQQDDTPPVLDAATVLSKEQVIKVIGEKGAVLEFTLQISPSDVTALPLSVNSNNMTFLQPESGGDCGAAVAAEGSSGGAVAAAVDDSQDAAVTSSQQQQVEQQQQQQEMEVVPSTSSGGGKEKRKRVRNRTHEGPKPQRAYQLSRDEAKDKDQRTKIRQAQNAKRTRDRQKAEKEALMQENAELKMLLKEKDDLIAKIREEKRLLEAAVRGTKGGGGEKRRAARGGASASAANTNNG